MILKITEPGKRWRKADGGATSSQLKRRRDLNLEAARLQADDGGSERPLDTKQFLNGETQTAGLHSRFHTDTDNGPPLQQYDSKI